MGKHINNACEPNVIAMLKESFTEGNQRMTYCEHSYLTSISSVF